MAKKRKKYLVTTNSEAFACSLVTSPAVEETFVCFNEDEPIVEKFADEKKHLITGVVAIPNKPIYRRNADGEEFDIVFSSEAIEKMAKDFMKDYRQHEVTLQHQENADGVYLVEQWIKNDMVYDKSIAVGLSRELPVGSWIQTYYVDSKDVWDRIESGELQGFSLECMLGLEEFESQITKENNNTMTDTNDMGFWKQMRELLNEVFGSQKNEGDTIEPVDITDLEEQTPPTVEEPTVETPKVEEPKVEEPKPAEEPTVETPKVETPTVEEPKPQEPNPLEELVKNLTEEIKSLKEMNEGLTKKVKELGKQPSTKPLNTNGSGGNPAGVESSTYAAWRETMRQFMN